MNMATRKNRTELLRNQRLRRSNGKRWIVDVVGALLFVCFFAAAQTCVADVLYDVQLPERAIDDGC